MTEPVDAVAAAVVCQSAAVMLQYPDEPLVRDRLPVVVDALRALPSGPARDGLSALAEHLRDSDPRELAEAYVAVFDRRKRCCLHLTWWADGETRRRGQALAELKDRYRRAGAELVGSELPDYLPVVLEYAAGSSLVDGLSLLQDHRAGLELLRMTLQEMQSAYAGAVAAVCTLLPGESPQDRESARRLARTGPPAETVGLEPFTVGGRR